MAGVFDGTLYHFLSRLVRDNVSHFQANAFRQTKMVLRARDNKNCATKQETSKI
jgi:hypothetical protein